MNSKLGTIKNDKILNDRIPFLIQTFFIYLNFELVI